MTNNR